MAAVLHHLPARQDADAVRIADGGEAMRHHQAGPPHCKTLQGCLDHSLAGNVQCRGGLVQKEDLRYTEGSHKYVCI